MAGPGIEFNFNGLQFLDEGINKGYFSKVNFIGAGVNAVPNGNEIDVTINGGIGSVPLGVENIFVSKSGNDATGTNADIAKSYLTITAAIAKAVTLTPSATNSINIIIYDGTYIETPTVPEWVNLISATASELIYDGVGYSTISSSSSGKKRPVYISGSITLSGSNIRLVGFNCNSIVITPNIASNLFLSHLVITSSISGNIANQYNYNVKCYDVHARSFFVGGTDGVQQDILGGIFINCTSGNTSFCSSPSTDAGILAATMYNCIAGTNSFASATLGLNGGTITGKLINCSGGSGSFAGTNSGGSGGTIDITAYLEDCTGVSFCFASSQSGAGGAIVGRMVNCIAPGQNTFASGASGGIIATTAIMVGCIQTRDDLTTSFASGNAGSGGLIEGKMINCISYGTISFGSGSSGGGTFDGYLDGCIGSGIAFFSCSTGTAGQIQAAGRVINCKSIASITNISIDGSVSFCSSVSGQGGSVAGFMQDCSWDGGYGCCSTNSVGSTGGFITGTIINCGESNAAAGNSFGSNPSGTAGQITGIMQDCYVLSPQGYVSGVNGGLISGVMTNCNSDGYNCFAAGTAIGGTISGKIVNCLYTNQTTDASFSMGQGGTTNGSITGIVEGWEVRAGSSAYGLGKTVLTGKLRNCRIKATNSGGYSPVLVGAGAIIENCAIKPAGGEFAILSSTGGALNIDARHCDFFGGGVDPLVTILTVTPYNTDEAASLF